MFRKSYNRAVLRIRIETVTPLLIRAGDAGLAPTAADLACVRTHHARYGSTVFIPGSSLKGVLRSAAETMVRGDRFKNDVEGACNPLDHDTSCGRRQNMQPSHQVHKSHCLACRLFGSLRMKGRAGVRDLLPWTEAEGAESQVGPGGENHQRANRIEVRHGVAIDRIVGSVKIGPFDQELVPAGVSFFGDIALENYQAWQLGLLAESFAEMNDGFAQLGSSKSRGLGVARIDVQSILHEQALSGGTSPVGAGMLASAEERNAYGLFQDAPLSADNGEVRGLSRRFTVRGDADVRAWLDGGRAALRGLR